MNQSKHNCLPTENHYTKSVFKYIVDDSMYVNKNECNDYTPPFLTYISSGIQPQNIDIENELRGAFYHNTKCSKCKYRGFLQTQPSYKIKPECPKSFKILPNGYLNTK
jgi:hypothetical protein